MTEGRDVNVTDDSARTLAIVGLACGVVGFVMLLGLGLGILGLPFTVAAIVLGVVSRRRSPSGMATADIILGVFTIVLVGVLIALLVGGVIGSD